MQRLHPPTISSFYQTLTSTILQASILPPSLNHLWANTRRDHTIAQDPRELFILTLHAYPALRLSPRKPLHRLWAVSLFSSPVPTTPDWVVSGSWLSCPWAIFVEGSGMRALELQPQGWGRGNQEAACNSAVGVWCQNWQTQTKETSPRAAELVEPGKKRAHTLKRTYLSRQQLQFRKCVTRQKQDIRKHPWKSFYSAHYL